MRKGRQTLAAPWVTPLACHNVRTHGRTTHSYQWSGAADLQATGVAIVCLCSALSQGAHPQARRGVVPKTALDTPGQAHAGSTLGCTTSMPQRKNAWSHNTVIPMVGRSQPASKRCSCTPYADQRNQLYIQAQRPITVSSTRVYLLCCQPQPILRKSTARVSQLTPRHSCRLLTWEGGAIHMRRRT